MSQPNQETPEQQAEPDRTEQRTQTLDAWCSAAMDFFESSPKIEHYTLLVAGLLTPSIQVHLSKHLENVIMTQARVFVAKGKINFYLLSTEEREYLESFLMADTIRFLEKLRRNHGYPTLV